MDTPSSYPYDLRIKFICEALIEQPADSSRAAQWREQARLLFALRKIANGERIIDIAFDCGYASQSAFFGYVPATFMEYLRRTSIVRGA